jgi:hypothetical protein
MQYRFSVKANAAAPRFQGAMGLVPIVITRRIPDRACPARQRFLRIMR